MLKSKRTTKQIFSFRNKIFQVDFDELDLKLNKLENDCRAAFDHLRAISKHETPQVKTKYVFLQLTFRSNQRHYQKFFESQKKTFSELILKFMVESHMSRMYINLLAFSIYIHYVTLQ
jgi:hypothetical protein